jgi:hypothetical protein
VDPTRFDAFARALSAQPTRRGVLRLLAGAGLGGVLGARRRVAAAAACRLVAQTCDATRVCCAGARCATDSKTCVCKAGFTACPLPAGGRQCFDLQTDERHCGTCARTCDAATQTCSKGRCCPKATPTFCVTNPTTGAGVCVDPCGGGCTPNCAGKCGGPDGCGGTCPGTCAAPQTCGGGGTPGVCGCTPNCAGKDCRASDGCGGICLTGSCPDGQICETFGCRTIGVRFACTCGDGTTRYACQQAEGTALEWLAICAQVCAGYGGKGGELGGDFGAVCTI